MSNLLQRILVALVSIPLILWFSYTGGYVFGFFIAFIEVLALSEFYSLARAKGARPHKKLGAISVLFLTIIFFHERLGGTLGRMPNQFILLTAAVGILVIVTLLVELKRAGSVETNEPLINIASTVFGIAYVGLSLSMLVGIRELFSYLPLLPYESRSGFAMLTAQEVDRWGGVFVMAIFTSIWVCDSAAYFIGRAWGKRKLFERVSPKKTWAGSIAGFVATGIVFFICSQLGIGKIFRSYDWIVFTIIVGVFGQIGDLAESLLKRTAEIKDSSGLLPGHGGVLDRFDSLIFVAPLVYLYLVLVVFPFQ